MVTSPAACGDAAGFRLDFLLVLLQLARLEEDRRDRLGRGLLPRTRTSTSVAATAVKGTASGT